MLFNVSPTLFLMSTATKIDSKTEITDESKIRTELKNYQQKTFDAFEKLEPELKAKLELPHDVTQQKISLDTFLSKAKEDKAPIEKRIMTMKRLPIVVRENGVAIRKDFLEVNSQLYSKDWKNDDLWIREYIQRLSL